NIRQSVLSRKRPPPRFLLDPCPDRQVSPCAFTTLGRLFLALASRVMLISQDCRTFDDVIPNSALSRPSSHYNSRNAASESSLEMPELGFQRGEETLRCSREVRPF